MGEGDASRILATKTKSSQDHRGINSKKRKRSGSGKSSSSSSSSSTTSSSMIKASDDHDAVEATQFSEVDCDLSLPWGDIWCALKGLGWKYSTGDLVNPYYYLRPGAKKSKAEMGKDMFHSEESVMTYLASLKPIQDPPEDEYDQLSVLEEEGAVVVDEEEEQEKREMSLLDIDLNLKWRDIWCCLSDCGWRWVPGDENSIYYYVKPQYQEANARLGIDKFASEDDVVTHIARQQGKLSSRRSGDFRDGGGESGVEDIILELGWDEVWDFLKKQRGWTWAPGDLLHSYFYVRPNRSKTTGVLGEDYFKSQKMLCGG